jgi:hypothetical protein
MKNTLGGQFTFPGTSRTVCTFCSREFSVPMSALSKTSDAQTNLQEQFDKHKCVPEDANQAA